MTHTNTLPNPDPAEPGPFLLWRIEFIRIMQHGIAVSPNLLQVLLRLGTPPVMVLIAFIWTILIDFTGGLGMFAVLCEGVIAAGITQSVVKLPRPFWITRNVLVGETTSAACSLSRSFGFPSEQVTLVSIAFTYLAAYVAEHSDRWSVWFYDHDSETHEARQRKLWMRVMSLVLLVSVLGIVTVLVVSVAVLYTGINFVHDVIFAALMGFGLVVVHMSAIQPLLFFPMCRYSLRTESKRGFFIPILYSFAVGGLLPLSISALSFVLAHRIDYPDKDWESVASDHCGKSYRIIGDASTYYSLFKASGLLCGICISFCPLLVKFVPAQLTFRRAGMSGLFMRVAGFVALGAPLVITAILVQKFAMTEIYAVHRWWLMFFGMFLEFCIYTVGAVWVFVCIPFLLHLWNERAISMRIRFYERLVYYRRERPLPLLQQVETFVRRSLDIERRGVPPPLLPPPISRDIVSAARPPRERARYELDKSYVFPRSQEPDLSRRRLSPPLPSSSSSSSRDRPTYRSYQADHTFGGV